jgi:Flp pilus assembly pilin Flp
LPENRETTTSTTGRTTVTTAGRQRWLAREDGQAIVEYAFVVALVSLVVVTVLGEIGVNVNAILEDVRDGLAGG